MRHTDSKMTTADAENAQNLQAVPASSAAATEPLGAGRKLPLNPDSPQLLKRAEELACIVNGKLFRNIQFILK